MISAKEEKPKVQIRTQGIPVKTLMPEKISTTLEMKLWGEVKYRRDISLKSEVEGRVLSVNPELRPGYIIDKGEVLLKIDNERLLQRKAELHANLLAGKAELSQLSVELKTLKSEVKLAAENVKLAQEDVDRYEKLVKNSNASKLTLSNFKQTLLRAKSTRQQLLSRLEIIPERKAVIEARLKSTSASVALVERDIKDSEIKAPFKARITGKVADLGDYIRKGDLICNLVDPEWFEVWINMGVNERNALGAIQSVDFLGERYAEFRFLNELEKSIQADFLVFEVKGKKLKAGELVKVSVKGRKLDGVIVIPESALRNNRSSVYINVDSKLKIQAVKKVLVDQGKVYISDGLSGSEEVITTRLNELPEGTMIDASRD